MSDERFEALLRDQAERAERERFVTLVAGLLVVVMVLTIVAFWVTSP